MVPGRILLVLSCLLSAALAAGSGRAAAVAAVRASDGARLGAYSTILRTSIITSTTATDFFTCTQLISTLFGCTGRRRRRNVLRRDLLDVKEAEAAGAALSQPAPALASSRQPEPSSVSLPVEKEKLLLTIFTTSTTTVTFSTLTINSATTVSVTYYCTTPGMSTFPAC